MNKVKVCFFIICLSILVIFPAVHVFGETGKRVYIGPAQEDESVLIDEGSNSESYVEEKTPEARIDKETAEEITEEEEKTVLIGKEDNGVFYPEKKLPETRIDEKTGKEIKIIPSDDIPLISEYRMKEEGE